MVNQIRGACKHEDVFAATVPVAAMRFILSRAAWRGHGRCLCLWDVSVAFFHSTIEEEVFVRPPKIMRKDKTIWKLLQAMYGKQVASSRWQKLVRETLCDGHWKVLTSVPCVAYNETEDSLVMFHGDDSWLKVTTVHWTSWKYSRSSACRALVQQLVVKGCFCTGRYDGTNLDSRIDQIPNTWCVDCDFVAGRRETCCNAIHTAHWQWTSKHVERVERD